MQWHKKNGTGITNDIVQICTVYAVNRKSENEVTKIERAL